MELADEWEFITDWGIEIRIGLELKFITNLKINFDSYIDDDLEIEVLMIIDNPPVLKNYNVSRVS